MPEIDTQSGHVTQITVAEAKDGQHQDELLNLMTDRAKFIATQPGFISIILHRSLDEKRIVNYVEWASRDELVAAHLTPEFRAKWPQFGKAVFQGCRHHIEAVVLCGPAAQWRLWQPACRANHDSGCPVEISEQTVAADSVETLGQDM